MKLVGSCTKKRKIYETCCETLASLLVASVMLLNQIYVGCWKKKLASTGGYVFVKYVTENFFFSQYNGGNGLPRSVALNSQAS